MTSLQRRLQKLELRNLAYGLAAQPDGEAKRFLIARIQAIRERLQAARDRGEYVPTVGAAEVEVKVRLRAVLEDIRRKKSRELSRDGFKSWSGGSDWGQPNSSLWW